MRRPISLFAVCAMVPAMAGPLRAEPELSVRLCGGSARIAVPTGGPSLPGGSATVCCAKGCRSEEKRGRLDRSQ
jgi:hypothetical protein